METYLNVRGKTAKRIRKAVREHYGIDYPMQAYHLTKDAWKNRTGGHLNRNIDVALVERKPLPSIDVTDVLAAEEVVE